MLWSRGAALAAAAAVAVAAVVSAAPLAGPLPLALRVLVSLARVLGGLLLTAACFVGLVAARGWITEAVRWRGKHLQGGGVGRPCAAGHARARCTLTSTTCDIVGARARGPPACVCPPVRQGDGVGAVPHTVGKGGGGHGPLGGCVHPCPGANVRARACELPHGTVHTRLRVCGCAGVWWVGTVCSGAGATVTRCGLVPTGDWRWWFCGHGVGALCACAYAHACVC
jgi:hypothetical protein